MNKKKYFISGGSRFGEPRVLDRAGFQQVRGLEEADFVVFTGGSDIDPSIYKEDRHPTTYPSRERDMREIKDFHQARDAGKAMLGICRGAQLLNCLVGGSLFQDIHHPGFHMLTTDDGQHFISNSVHHQMLRVGDGAIIKAWTENLSAGHHLYMKDGVEANIPDVEKEPEIVLYPQHRMVLVQGHPEFNSEDSELETFRSYVFNLVKEIL